MDLTSMDPRINKKSKQFNIFVYNSKLALAFKSDCEDFLKKFASYKSCSFATFSELWREVNFLQIFKHQDNILALQTFLENCFITIKRFLFSDDLYVQTGALYLLFAVYNKQPIKKWIKIRLVRAENNKLKEIVELHRIHNPKDDFIFVYNKMRLDEMFQYCALNQQLGLEPRHLRRVDISTPEVAMRSKTESSLEKFKKMMEEDSDLVQFDATDEEYQKLADKYKGDLFVFPSQVGKELQQAYSEIFDINLGEQNMASTSK